MGVFAAVVLWACAPAFACLLPVGQHACCQGTMLGCTASAMSASSSCCQVHSSNTNLPADRLSASSRPRSLAPLLIAVPIPASPCFRNERVNRLGLQPPPFQSSAGSILRI